MNMEIKLTAEEAKVLVTFLNRVQLQGNEAETLVYLKHKLSTKDNGKGSEPKK